MWNCRSPQDDVAADLFPTLRRGDNDPDVTLLTYGGMLPVVEAAAKRLDGRGGARGGNRRALTAGAPSRRAR